MLDCLLDLNTKPFYFLCAFDFKSGISFLKQPSPFSESFSIT